MKLRTLKLAGEVIGFLAVLLGALWLRSVGLAGNPGWDIDEGYNISIARHLIEGRGQMLAVRQVFIQHPPLYFLLVGLGLMLAPDADALLVARTISAGLATLALLPLYFLARRLVGVRAAVFAGLAYSLSYLGVGHARFAYGYSVLLPLLPLALWLLLQVEARLTRRWLVALGATLAALLLAERLAVPAVAVALFWLLRRRGWRVALGVGALAVVPSALYLIPLALAQPEVFWFDAFHTGGRLGEGMSARLVESISSYVGFVGMDLLMPAGLVGIFALTERRGGLRVLGVFAGTVVLSVLLRDPRAYFRQMLPAVSLLALGAGVALDLAIGVAWRRTKRAIPFVAIALLVMLPLGFEGARSVAGALYGFRTEVQWLTAAESDAREAAEAINRMAGPDDLVVADAHLAWLLRAKTADWAQAAATTGRPVSFYPANMSPRYFAYDARLEAARLAVVDAFLVRWVEEEPETAVAPLYHEVVGHWRPVGSYGQFQVFERPSPE